MKTVLIYSISASLLLLAAFVVFRILFRNDYSRKRKLSPLSILIGTLIFFLWGGFPWIYGPADWPAVHIHPILETVGWILLWGGVAVMFIGIGQLGFSRTLGQKQDVLKQTGLYRLSRNPQVIGCILYGLGFALLWPSWYAVGWIALILAMTHLMVLTEEEYLHAVFGEDYKEYCKRVPRYVLKNPR